MGSQQLLSCLNFLYAANTFKAVGKQTVHSNSRVCCLMQLMVLLSHLIVTSDCSTTKAQCMLSSSLQSCTCVSEVCSYAQYAYIGRTHLALAALADSFRRKNGATAM